MKAAKIPQYMTAGAEIQVIGHPDTDEHDVHALVTRGVEGEKRFSVRCELEDGDLEQLARGGGVWLTFFSEQIPPFMVFTES